MQPADNSIPESGFLTPVLYAVSSFWMLAEAVANPISSTLHLVISIIPGVFIAIGSIVQTVGLIQHRREKLAQETYIRELEIRSRNQTSSTIR